MSGRLLRLAWRNLWRNPRRTLIAMAAIGLGYAMLLFVACLMAGLRQQMIESGTGLVLSDVEVHAPGYYPDRPAHQTLGGRTGTDVSALVAAIAADPRVQAASPRVYGYGLVSATHQSAGVQLLGVVPDQEQKITVLQTRMVKGSYLTGRMPKGVVMGDKLAAAIGVEVGSEIVLLTTAVDGSTGNDLYTVAGMFHTGLETWTGVWCLCLSLLCRSCCACRREGSMKLESSSMKSLRRRRRRRHWRCNWAKRFRFGCGLGRSWRRSWPTTCSSIVVLLLFSFSSFSCWQSWVSSTPCSWRSSSARVNSAC